MSASTPLPNPSETPKVGLSNLQQRLIFGVLGAVLLLGCVWFSPWTFGLFFAFVQAVMLWEFYRMMRAGGYSPATWIGVIVSVAVFGATALLKYTAIDGVNFATSGIHSGPVAVSSGWHTVVYPTPPSSWLIGMLMLLPIALVVREMVLWPHYEKPFSNIGATLTGLLYVTLPMSLLIGISYVAPSVTADSVSSAGGHYDYRRVFALLFLVWASDIGAYAAGKTFGKHKLAPSISPGKTWEGWAGGFIMTLIVGWAIGFMLPDMPLAHRLTAAGVVAIFGPLGDLAESMLKRSVGVKDSGSILPGHGGLLDRFDAFLLVLPVLALLQLLAR